MEITTSFVFLRADVDKCLCLVLLLPSTMTCLPLLLKNDDDGCAADVLTRPRMRRDAVPQVAVVGGFNAVREKKLGVFGFGAFLFWHFIFFQRVL